MPSCSVSHSVLLAWARSSPWCSFWTGLSITFLFEPWIHFSTSPLSFRWHQQRSNTHQSKVSFLFYQFSIKSSFHSSHYGELRIIETVFSLHPLSWCQGYFLPQSFAKLTGRILCYCVNLHRISVSVCNGRKSQSHCVWGMLFNMHTVLPITQKLLF